MSTLCLLKFSYITNLFQNQVGGMKIRLIFLTEIVVYSHAVIIKNADRAHVSFTPFPPLATFCRTTQWNSTARVLLLIKSMDFIRSSIIYLYLFVGVCVWSSIYFCRMCRFLCALALARYCTAPSSPDSPMWTFSTTPPPSSATLSWF